MNSVPRFSRFTLGSAMMLVAFTLMALWLSTMLRHSLRGALRPRDEGLRTAPVSGDLTFESGQDVAALRSEKEEKLHRLEWVDAQRQTAHIPIEDAMKIVASRYANSSRVKR